MAIHSKDYRNPSPLPAKSEGVRDRRKYYLPYGDPGERSPGNKPHKWVCPDTGKKMSATWRDMGSPGCHDNIDKKLEFFFFRRLTDREKSQHLKNPKICLAAGHLFT